LGVGLAALSWDTALVGHPKCNRGVMLATAGDRAIDLLTDRRLYERFLEEFRHVPFDRRDVRQTARRVVGAAFRSPYWLLRGGAFPAAKFWQARRSIWRRQRIGKITFFIHNFMDASALDPERIRNCSFMVMTEEGPVSMCEVNSRRDDFILPRVALRSHAAAPRFFDPRTGRWEEIPGAAT